MESSVSVVIPTRDRRALLPRALDSVRAQTRPPEEVLVVDDGSRDGTVQALAPRYPDFRFLRRPARGVSAARNAGIAAAGGEWVALLDSDDEWAPEKLDRQLAALAAAPSYDLCHCDEIWVRRGVRVNPGRRHAKSGGRLFRRGLELCLISPSAALVRRSVLRRLGGFDEALPACEDYDLWLRFCATRPVLYVDEPLVIKHGGHDDQLSRTVPALDRYRIRALVKILESGRLAAADRAAARAVLLEKIDIYGAGARRRGRTEEAARMERLRLRFAGSESRPAAGS